MKRFDPRAFALALLFVPVAYVLSWAFDRSEERRVEVAALFDIPEDATWAVFRAPTGRGGLRYAEAVIDFSPEQWEAWTAKLDDREAWNPAGLTFDGIVIPEPLSDEPLRWHDSQWAWITEEFACFWVDWGHEQSKSIDGKPKLWDTKAARSFCWALIDDGTPRVVPCRGIKHSPKGLKMYARAQLDAEHRRAFLFVK